MPKLLEETAPGLISQKQSAPPPGLESKEVQAVTFVRAIVLDPEGKVLLIRRKPESSFEGGKWELPGGKPHPGETLDGAILREVYEETGLHGELVPQVPIVDTRLMELGYNSHGGREARTETKLVMVDDSRLDYARLLTESTAGKWCLKADIERLYGEGVLSATTRDLIARVLLVE